VAAKCFSVIDFRSRRQSIHVFLLRSIFFLPPWFVLCLSCVSFGLSVCTSRFLPFPIFLLLGSCLGPVAEFSICARLPFGRQFFCPGLDSCMASQSCGFCAPPSFTPAQIQSIGQNLAAWFSSAHDFHCDFSFAHRFSVFLFKFVSARAPGSAPAR
jgi:hypothetical protein